MKDVRQEHYQHQGTKGLNTYCMKCGCELQRKGGKTYMVDWAYID